MTPKTSIAQFNIGDRVVAWTTLLVPGKIIQRSSVTNDLYIIKLDDSEEFIVRSGTSMRKIINKPDYV